MLSQVHDFVELHLGLKEYSALQIAEFVGIALLVTVLSTWTYRVYFHPLAHIPGPFAAKLTHMWQNVRYWRGSWHQDILDVHEKYGPVVRISPDEISFVDGDALKRLYGHVKPCIKSKWYDVWYIPPAGHGVFSERSIETHGQLRRLAANAYSMSSILGYERKIQVILDNNWKRFRYFAASGTAIDMDHWATYFAYDIVSELALGNALGMVTAGSDVNYVMESVLGLFYMLSNLGHVPLQGWVVMNPASQWFFATFGNDSMKGAGRFRAWLEESVAKRYYSKDKPAEKDMLQHFIEATDRDGTPNQFPHVLSECGNVLGAGADTVSIGIRAVMDCLMRHPDVYERLQNEVDEFYDKSVPDGSEITYQQCLTLPYLQAVVKEAGRVYPSIMYQIPRIVPAEGITIAGYALPPGTNAGISARSMNRDKKIFGHDANEFRPDRWLEDESRARYMDSLLATFGYGGRTCIGKNIALVEMNKYIAQLIRHFDFEYENKEQPYHIFTVWFALQKDMFVRFKNRGV